MLSHVMEDSSEKPVACASHMLNNVEKRYSQLDKEALAIIFWVKRFHHYLYGRQFSIVSDHKSLQQVPSCTDHGICETAALGTTPQCLPIHDFVPTLANADGLSRLPLPDAPLKVTIPAEVISLLQTTVVSNHGKAHQIYCYTRV